MSEQNAEFERLLAAAIEGRADEAQIEALRKFLREDRQRRAEYAAQLQLHALLQWQAGTVLTNEEETEPKVIPFSPVRAGWWLAAAAAVVALLGVAFWMLQPPAQAPLAQRAPSVELEVLEATGVVGDGGAESYREGTRVSLDRLHMRSGMLRFRLTSGAVVTVNGPADVQLINAMRLRVAQGKLTADVGDHAKGFIVETAHADVVDLGTKFGVSVAESGHTDVVVFQGKVELFDRQKERPEAAPMAQLGEGEAVRVDGRQQMSRIANVTSGPGDEEWFTDGKTDPATVVASISDNLHAPNAPYFYRIIRGGMQEDAQAFIAKRHEWNGRDASGLPPWLVGADLVQTFGTGKANSGLELVVTLARPGVLYVFIDARNPPPAWLVERFTNTGATIALENAPLPESGIPLGVGPGVEGTKMAPFAVWQREMREGGSVTLGPPPEVPENRPNWMYGLAAKAL